MVQQRFVLWKDVALFPSEGLMCVFASFSLLPPGICFQFSGTVTGMCADMFWHEAFKMLSSCVTANKN